MEKLEEWYKPISECEKLAITEAQELYRKTTTTSDETLKKLYMDKLILGTLHVVYNHIKKNKLELFVSASYDMEDVISCFTQVWIKRIYNGDLLKYSNYQSMFTVAYYNEVCDMLCSNDINLSEIFRNSGLVASGFEEYIEYKDSGEEAKSFEKYLLKNDYIWYKRHWSDGTCHEIAKLTELYEKIYNNLNCDKEEDLEVKKSRIYNILKLLICLGLTEPLKEDFPEESFEDSLIHDMINSDFVKDMDKALVFDRLRKVVHLRFGFDDGEPKILDEIGAELGISKNRSGQMLKKALRRIKGNRNFLKKHGGDN